MFYQEQPLQSNWNNSHVARLSPPELLVYRSNLLGIDKRITNYGGGNTSSKTVEKDPLTGQEVKVLWVKGSGGDMGTITLEGFASLYMDKLQALKKLYRGQDHEDEMVGYLPHCAFNLNPRAASIDTPLHAYIPRACVDHMHPDAIIAIATAADGPKLTEEIFGDEIGWLPWRRPGYELGLWLETFCRDNPNAKGVILGSHGLFTWADDAKTCYETTLVTINRATAWLAVKTKTCKPFGGARYTPLEPAKRKKIVAALLPALRGLISTQTLKIAHFDDSDAVLTFVSARGMPPLARLGTSCPDHFLRTKTRPLVIDFDPQKPDLPATLAGLAGALDDYRADYHAYYNRCKHADSPTTRDANPVVYLIPGVGLVTFAHDKTTARIASEFYINAINVIAGASGISRYQGLPEQEAFNIEYWLLEEAKLQRLPAPKSLAGRIALITGASGGIGAATARQLLREGACVVLTDIDTQSLQDIEKALIKDHGPDRIRAVVMDITSEKSIDAGFHKTILAFGGIDILVSCAGVVSGDAIEKTSLESWNRNMAILSTGYFLGARATFRLLEKQGMGGSIIFVASKNGLAASPNASAYATAKASEIHLARCLALEGGSRGIRVNVVNPDAVLHSSKMWNAQRRQERAKTYGKKSHELEAHYRDRSLLKRSVFPEDIAKAIYFLASDDSSKSTGNIINVDAGNAQSFPR